MHKDHPDRAGSHYPKGCNHARFTGRSWLVQRVAWAMMAGIVGAASLGAFGRGLLSHARAATVDAGLVVRFDRIVRNNAPCRLEVEFEFEPSSGQERLATLWLSREYLDKFKIESTEPPTESAIAMPERLGLVFAATGPVARVTLNLEARSPGSADGQIGLGQQVDPARTLSIRQFILP